MTIHYGFGESIFGSTFLALSDKKICALAFVEKKSLNQELKKIKKCWPRADLMELPASEIQKKIEALIPKTFSLKKKLNFEMAEQGTEFQNKVWRALQNIPAGQTQFYSEIANQIGHPKAIRAVGAAVGANPLAYLIPCHRVLPKSGGLGQFAWGVPKKAQMLRFENCKI